MTGTYTIFGPECEKDKPGTVEPSHSKAPATDVPTH